MKQDHKFKTLVDLLLLLILNSLTHGVSTDIFSNYDVRSKWVKNRYAQP